MGGTLIEHRHVEGVCQQTASRLQFAGTRRWVEGVLSCGPCLESRCWLLKVGHLLIAACNTPMGRAEIGDFPSH